MAARRIKLYTKTGDKGKTSLYDGSRTGKDELIFDVLGNLDELNCNIGMLWCYECKIFFRIIQYNLTNIASNIATPKKNKNLVEISDGDIKTIEQKIDNLQQRAPILKEFVLPGINKSNSQAHICRTLTRRLERSLYKLWNGKEISGQEKNILIYINRLSDYFFACALVLSNSKEVKISEIKKIMKL